MKRLLLFTAVVLTFTSTQARAASLTDPGVPHTINLQSIVYDAQGKPTQSDRVDISIRILDADNNVVFEENHTDVIVVKSAISLNIGEGDGSSGIPLDVLDPSTGAKFLDVMVEGSNPWDLMPLGAVPYAMWAEKAVMVSDDSIGSEQIKDGSIKAEDIDPLAFSDIQGQLGDSQLPGSAVTVSQLQSHLDSTSAHPASAIVVSGNFITMVAADVQTALQKLDVKLAEETVNRQNGQKVLTDNVTNLQNVTSNINNIPGTLSETKIDAAMTRDTEVIGIADTALTTPVEASDIADSRISNAISANVIPDSPSDIGAAPASHTHAGSDIVSGTVADSWIASTIARDSEVTSAVNAEAASRANGDSNLQGQVNNLSTTVSDHETRITALEGEPAPNAKVLTLSWVTNQDNTSGGKLSGDDAASWTLSGVNTGDGKWASITRSSITVPSDCIPIVSGTVSPNVADGDVISFDYDDPAFLKITYSGTGQRTINFKVYALGNDGEYDINIHVTAIPTAAASDCSIP